MGSNHHKIIPTNERFFKYVQADENGCLLWTGTTNKMGYGQFSIVIDGKWGKVLAHRWFYEQTYGPIPKGLVLDHRCRKHNCVNPDPEHLELVTQRENILRGMAPSALSAQRTTCLKGHPYDADNTYIGKNGARRCRKCSNLNQFERKRGIKHTEIIPKAIGEGNGKSKLTMQQVNQIREMFATGNYTKKAIADIFKCSDRNVGSIVTFQTWK